MILSGNFKLKKIMPTINPKTFAIILLATFGQEVGSFMVQLPKQLLIKAQSRAVNFGIQYGAMAIGQSVVGSKFIDPTSPAKLFAQGVESLTSTSTLEEATSRGTVALGVLIMSSLSSEDPNTSLTFAGFLLVLVQNVLQPGSQVIFFSQGLLKISILKTILIRVITEIQIERERRRLKLPRPKFKFNIFKKQEKRDLVFKYLRFKKRKLKILSREISLPVLYIIFLIEP
jgi:hypothetical protein